MSLYRFFVSFLLLCFLTSGEAQGITRISGHAPDLRSHTVYLYGYHDFISESKFLLDSMTISSEGGFDLTFESDEVLYVQLVSDYISAHLYTQPGSSYDVELPLPSTDQPKAFGRKSKTEVIFTIWTLVTSMRSLLISTITTNSFFSPITRI